MTYKSLQCITVNDEQRKEKAVGKQITIRIGEEYKNALEEISKTWGNVPSKSDTIRYCIWYTWKHAIKNNKKK